jgi:DNA-binding winged helix-turn-helix (wHTH) protein/tetratricopeptide (TPR) repeat protein
VTQAPERHRFADFELDASTESLTRDGVPQHLTPKAFAVLLHLVRARGALVTREALFDAHWPGMVVGNDALTRCIVELRRVLDDDAKAARFVATVHRRGFRFVAPLERAATLSAPQPQPAPAAAPAPAPQPAQHPAQDTTPAVGRDAELARARGAIADACAGQGRLLCIHGEPGIGKSHLLAAIEASAATAGMQVRSLRADDIGALSDIGELSDVAATLEARHYKAGGGMGDFGPDGWDATAARRQLLVARSNALLATARAQPLLLACDDLEGASADVLALLLRIADDCTQAPLLLALAWRDVARPANEDFDAALAALLRCRTPRVDLALRGLDDANAAQLAEQAGASLSAGELARTAGNPLFVGELARLVARTPANATMRTVPDGLRPVLRARFARLDATTRGMLETAAVVGLHGQRALLEAVTAESPAIIEDALADAARERLLLCDAEGGWRFTHALLRDAVYESLLPGTRARLHSHIGHALARIVAGANEPPLAALAEHFERGLPEDIPRAIEYGHRAGVHALLAGASAEGCALLDHAIERASARADTAAGSLCDMLLAASYAHAVCGRPQRARVLVQAAVQRARDALAREAHASGTRRLARALRLACDLEPSYPQNPEVVAWLDEALALMPEGDDAMHAELLARRSFQAYLRGDTDTHARVALAAVDLARRAGDARALDDALTSQAYALAHPRHEHALRALHDERMRLARTLGDRQREFDVRRQRLERALQAGPRAEVMAEFEGLAALGTLLDTPSARATLLRVRAGLAIAEGRLDDGWTLAQDAVAEGQQATDSGTVSAIAILQFGAILGMRDDPGRVQPDLRDSPGSANSLVKAAMIYLAAHHGTADYARWQLRELAANDFAALPKDATWGIALSNLAMSCETLGDTDTAATLHPLLAPWAGRSLTALCYYNAGCGARFLGLLDAVMGRHADAAAHFEAALQVDARMGATAWQVHTAIDYARTVLPHLPDRTRAQQAARTRLATLLRTARDDAARLGLTVPRQRAEAVLDAQAGERRAP